VTGPLDRGAGRPTCSGAPRRFALSSREAAAARAWLEEGELVPSCPLRTAASVVYTREGEDGLETFLTYRPTPASPLGRVGFPGGVVEPRDGEPIGWYGPTPEQWAQKFGGEDLSLARGAVVAAIRESFEEVGILLAGPDQLATVEHNEASETMASREAVAGQELSFADHLRRGGLKLRTDLLKPLGRWQSPDFSHRRFDTHYFAAAVPVGQRARLLGSKGVWGRWVSARALMRDPESTALGEEIGTPETRGQRVADLVTPGCLCLLESLSRCETTVAFLTRKRPVRVKKAELVRAEGGLFLEFTPPPDVSRAREKGA
jgi:8-oxo-dGTP pyrophosphatase MutT (NUDIX family)